MTENLLASAPGTYDDYNQHGGFTKADAINPPDDDSTSYIYSYALNNKQSFTLLPSAIPPGSTINSVSVSSRSNWIATPSTYKNFLRLAGTEVTAPTISPPVYPNWQTYVDAISRPGGGPWSLADLATLEIGVTCDSGNTHLCTTLFAVIDYTPPAPPGPTTGDMLLMF